MSPISWTTKTAKNRAEARNGAHPPHPSIAGRQRPNDTLTLGDPSLDGPEQGELAVQQTALNIGEGYFLQPRETGGTKEVAELRGRLADVQLTIDRDVDPVLDHRPHAHQEHPLPARCAVA